MFSNCNYLSKALIMRFFGALSLTLLSWQLHAEGYQVNLQGQKNTAMGHTGTALTNGASSIHFNPGALIMMPSNFDFSLGSSGVISQVRFDKKGTDYSAETNNPMGTPLYFYAASKINDKLAAGISLTTPYGNSLEWDSNWDGRYLIQDISMKSFFIQPTLSYKLTDKLGIGAGAMIVIGSVDLNKALPIQSTDAQTGNSVEASTNLSGSASSVGFNVGAFYQASEALSIGLDYRSKVVMSMDGGDAYFNNIPSALSATYYDTKFNAELPLPANLTLGIAYKCNSKLTLAADFQYVFWSAYDELVFEFDAETIPTSVNQRDYHNTMIYRLGAEYAVSAKFEIMAGAYYDQTPIEDNLLNPETPGMNKVGLSCGFRFKPSDRFSIDASMLYIKGLEREAGYEPEQFYGTYNSQAFIPGIGLNYTF